MAASLRNNAYHVLGLDSSATSRQILQRANELTQRLLIDDRPPYDLDMPGTALARTEETVRDALRRLQNPKSRLQEFFLWFAVVDDVDRSAVQALKIGNHTAAAKIWGGAPNQGGDGARYRRNAALACTLSLFDKTDLLQSSLQAWRSFVHAEPFWSSFVQAFASADSIPLSEDALRAFRENVLGYLSDVYAEAGQARKANYVLEFQKVFAAKGERVEQDVLRPIAEEVEDAIAALDAIQLDEARTFDAAAADKIRVQVARIQTALNKSKDAGLFDDSETKRIRDQAAGAIRSVVLALNNEHSEYEKARRLLEIAITFAGTESRRAMLIGELEQIQNNAQAEKDSRLEIEIPGTFGGGTVVFSEDSISYNGRTIAYKDATSLSFHAVNQSVNFVPISQSYSYLVASKDQKISFSFGSTLYIGNAKKKDVWARLVGISQHLIEPQIVRKTVDQIFNQQSTVKIGDIEFDHTGYSTSTFFGGRKTVKWSEVQWLPEFSQGSVIVWMEKKGKGVPLSAVEMSRPNAVVIPGLVKACIGLRKKYG